MKSKLLLLIFGALIFLPGCVNPIRNETALHENKIPLIKHKANFSSKYVLNELLQNKVGWKKNLIFLSNDLAEGLKQDLVPVNQSPTTTMPQMLSQVTLKGNVDTFGLSEKMLPVIINANAIWLEYKKTLVITSARDGKHCKNSLHYNGLALDFRTRDLSTTQRKAIKNDLSLALGHQFTVLLERDHFHVELDENRLKGAIQHLAKN